jgi:branched-subunit amino acid transport protein
MNIWWLMLVSGAATFLIRYSFIAAEGHYQPPAWFRRLLPFVPIAALTALTAPELLLLQGEIVLGADNARLWAGVVAIVVAAVWRNTLLTIGVGFLALFLIQRC